MERGEGYKKKYTFTQRRPATTYYCRECNKVFKHPSKIAEHQRKHTKERPFGCDLCEARFTQKGAMKVHMRGHMGELPYKCSYCDRCFATHFNQRNHELVHIRGGRVHRAHVERMMMKDGVDPSRLKSLSSSSRVKGGEGRGREEGGEMEAEVYECCVHNCGYQHTIREMVESHVTMEHAELWESGETGGGGGGGMEEGEEGGEYPGYVYYEYVDQEGMMDDQEVVVMTEEEVAAATAGVEEGEGEGEEEEEQMPSTSTHHPSLHPLTTMHPMDCHPTSTTGGYGGGGERGGLSSSSLVIEADEHMDERMRKVMTEDHRTKRMLTLGRTAMEGGGGRMKEEEGYYSAEAPLASYEVEVMTSRNVANPLAAMVEDEDDEPQPVFSELTQAVFIPDEETGRVRMLADRQPPHKGRKTTDKQWETLDNMEEMEVDMSLLDEVMPQQRIPRGSNRRKKRAGPPVQSRNLDWIIDAVAQGIDVDMASPHNRKKPVVYTCEFCGKVDKYPSKIEAHRRTHTGEKPFKCDICDKSFTQRTPYRMHMRRHFGQHNFVCEFDGCEARFVSQALLNAHQSAKHLHTRRFVCMKGCGRWFVSGRNQRQHEMRCTHVIARTTVNTDYSLDLDSTRYTAHVTDDDVSYHHHHHLAGVGEEEEEVEVDEDDDYGRVGGVVGGMHHHLVDEGEEEGETHGMEAGFL